MMITDITSNTATITTDNNNLTFYKFRFLNEEVSDHQSTSVIN